MFSVFTELELINDSGMLNVEKGAKALVVDGQEEFPDLYKQLTDHFRANNTSFEARKNFIWVKWDKTDNRYHGIPDGAYMVHRFAKTENKKIEPKNNDGRQDCYWCQNKTKTVQGITSNYQICSKCGK